MTKCTHNWLPYRTEDDTKFFEYESPLLEGQMVTNKIKLGEFVTDVYCSKCLKTKEL